MRRVSPCPESISRVRETSVEPDQLSLFDYNCAFFADFDTAFAAETFFCVYRHRFTILHLEYFDRTYIHALFTTGALFFIDDRIKSHQQTLLSIYFFEMVPTPLIRVGFCFSPDKLNIQCSL